jgi:transposase InsO family protein
MLCQALNVTRSGYYAYLAEGRQHVRSSTLNETLLVTQIKRVFEESERTAGYRKVYFLLKDQDIPCSMNQVKKLMNKHGIRSAIKRKYKPQMTTTDPEAKAFDNLLDQNFSTSAKNEVWAADITYIKVGFKWTYLAVVIDLYNREPVGWAFGLHPNAPLACDALKMAICRERPHKGLMHHSDRGCQYTSNDYRELLDKHQMIGSMSRKGNPYDNAVAESFFRALKTEWASRFQYNTMREAYQSLYRYIEVFYKYQRLHEALGYKTPKDFEKQQKNQILVV